ncbi:hypothetical protein ACFWIO_27875 [Streptomyces diastatochromogenes]|uniref:hypothetical protein n=1 Tax=Streptomyces diastatochromogenes TaxID=42236 RepID=UPI0036530B69
MSLALAVAHALDLGNVPAWVSTASVVIAAATFWRAASDKKREQASKVAAWVDNYPEIGKAVLHLRNNSEAPIYRLTVVGKEGQSLYDHPELEPNQHVEIPVTNRKEVELFLRTVEAVVEASKTGSDVSHRGASRKESREAAMEPGVCLHFRDALGRWWLRKKSGRIAKSRRKIFPPYVQVHDANNDASPTALPYHNRVSSDSNQNRSGVDEAALGSAAVAAVVTLALGEGPYGWLSSGVGATLALLLAAYYRPRNTLPRDNPDTYFRACAFGAIAGLLVAMILAWPVQWGLGREGLPYRKESNPAEPWVAWIWLVSSVALAVGHRMMVPPAPREGD